MTPSERSFLTAVVRFQTLLHAGVSQSDGELWHLRRFLAADAPDAWPEPDDRRQFRRFSMRVEALVRRGDLTFPCTVIDLGGGGLRVRHEARAQLETGEHLILTVQANESAERIDLPVAVRFVAADNAWFGVEFVGAPLTMRHHRRVHHPSRDSKSKTQEVPFAAAA